MDPVSAKDWCADTIESLYEKVNSLFSDHT